MPFAIRWRKVQGQYRKTLRVSGAGLGSFQRVQEVHGYVHHHCQSEGHIPTSGRHLTQVPSQVRFRGKNASCELCIVTQRFYSNALPCARSAFSCTACSATAAETKREHAQHKVSTHLDYSPRNGNQSHDKFEAKALTALLQTCHGSDCRSLGWSHGSFEAML